MQKRIIHCCRLISMRLFPFYVSSADKYCTGLPIRSGANWSMAKSNTIGKGQRLYPYPSALSFHAEIINLFSSSPPSRNSAGCFFVTHVWTFLNDPWGCNGPKHICGTRGNKAFWDIQQRGRFGGQMNVARGSNANWNIFSNERRASKIGSS